MKSKDFRRVVFIGYVESYPTFCKVKYTQGKLSIIGVIRPDLKGDALSCGQINDTIKDALNNGEINFNDEGWDTDLLNKFLNVWEEFHLNDMQAGTPKQTECLKQAKENGITFKDYYTDASNYLADHNLLHDNGYKFGSAWLKIEVPQDILDFLSKGLPKTKRIPAWI